MLQIQHAQSLRDRDRLQVVFALYNVTTSIYITNDPNIFAINHLVHRL